MDYEQRAITLAPGDRLFIYTDGLTEMKNPDGDLFTVERLRAAIEAGADDDLEAHGERVLAAADAFRADADLSDDLALVIFEIT